jgi:MBG domain (YGX type)/Bacterial Ig-like domain (group 3)
MRHSPHGATARRNGIGPRGKGGRAHGVAIDFTTRLLNLAAFLTPPDQLASIAGRSLRIEALEDRSLLSAASTSVEAVANTMGATSPSFTQQSSPDQSYLFPSAMQSAYATSGITFGNITGNGAGQTIAIVDAYDDPNIASDLQAFDAQYSLPNPTFTKVNQFGQTSNYPITDPAGAGPDNNNWEVEEALDVEWAHSMAPGANIVLVEANSSSLSDLLASAVEASALGSVVSMSFTFTANTGNPGEFRHEANDDPDFQASGVTFLGSTGDAGSPGGYPAYSPDVVAVGGTVLTVHANTFTYSSETAWSGSGGGTSQFETEPAYQNNVQSTGKRTIPDVSADSGVGVWIYDSYNNTNSGGSWFGGVGGTSLSTPMWAGLIAIADQGRAAEGKPALTGFTQTLPALYSLPSADFHDVTSGSNGSFSAGTGYDEVTGIGSPVGNLLVPGLAAYGDASQIGVTAQPPSPVTPNVPFGLTVAAEDSFGNVDSSYNGSVTISLGNNPGGSTLSGTLTATAVNGVATFSNLTLNQNGVGYTLHAAATGLTTATTNSFNVGSTSSTTTTASTDHPLGSVYGQTDTFTATVTSGGGTPTGTVQFQVDGSNVGSPVTLSGGTANFSTSAIIVGGHTITAVYTTNSINFTNSQGNVGENISPAPLTVTANSPSTVYGAGLPALTFNAIGFVNGDTAGTALTGSLSTTATGSSPATTYPINQGTLSAANYNIFYNAGTLTITPAPLTITADSKSKSLGSANPTLTFTPSGFVNGDTSASLTTQPTVSTTATTNSPIGSYPITASSAVDSNYTISYVAGTLTITGTPPEVTGLFVTGSTWNSAFKTSLVNNSLGNATYGYALQTGSTQLTTLPWTNINTIEVQFNEAVNLSQSSLELLGGTGGSTPSVTGFSSLGNNVYAWTLSGPLTDNRYLIALPAAGVTDSEGDTLDGEWATSTSTFPSGDGNPGGNFNFFFNVLPGDVDQTTLVNANDFSKVRSKLGDTTGNTAYVPYFDIDGNGLINANDVNAVRARLGSVLPGNSPSPQAAQVGGLQTDDSTGQGVALAAQEGTTTSTGGTSTSIATASSLGNVVAAPLGSSTTHTASSHSSHHETWHAGLRGSSVKPASETNRERATDHAVADFDLVDLWV